MKEFRIYNPSVCLWQTPPFTQGRQTWQGRMKKQSLRLSQGEKTTPQSPVSDSSTATAMPLPFSAVASVGAKRLPPASSAPYTGEPKFAVGQCPLHKGGKLGKEG